MKLIEQLLLCQAIGQTREDIAVDEVIVSCQLTGQGSFWPTFDLCGDHRILIGHRFRLGIQTDRINCNPQRLTGLTQHTS
ncbi:hypothetical protein D3C77_771310 [compost metagenome]